MTCVHPKIILKYIYNRQNYVRNILMTFRTKYFASQINISKYQNKYFHLPWWKIFTSHLFYSSPDCKWSEATVAADIVNHQNFRNNPRQKGAVFWYASQPPYFPVTRALYIDHICLCHIMCVQK